MLLEYFDSSKTSVQKLSKKTVVKVVFDTEHEKSLNVKVNLFDTGSVNIQGLKSATFTDCFFDALKLECDNYCEKTHPKKLLCKSKSSDDLLLSPNVKVVTPARKSCTLGTPGPKEKATALSKSIESKFADIQTALTTVDETMKTFMLKLSEIQISMTKVPETIQNIVQSSLTLYKKKIQENLDSIESRIKHCNSTVDALHVKSNIIDTQLKKIESCQDSFGSNLSDVMAKMISLEDRVINMESKVSSLVNRAPPELEESDFPFNSTIVTQESLNRNHLASPAVSDDNPVPKSTRSNSQPNIVITPQQKMCDYLILGDSLLRRILPKRFTPRGSTTKRFIRGGAATCSNFVEKYGSQFYPKNVIIHVGTRELQNGGVKETNFVDLIKVCRESWRDANIYISLITERKDLPNDCVSRANQSIRLACEKAQNLGIHVSIIEQFKPSEDMFHDDIHLNNKGVAAIVKHIKLAVGLSGNRDAKRVNVQRPYKQNMSVKYSPNAPKPNVSQSDPAFVHHPLAGAPFVKPPFLPNMQWQNPFTCMWPPYPMWPPMPPHQINGDRSI